MQLKDVMARDVEVIAPDASLREAAEKMRALDIGSVPVCDGRRLIGMVTDRDITVRAVAEGRDPALARVRDVMTPDVTYCYEDDDVKDAARLMGERQIRRLAVLDRGSKQLVGMVSLGDVAVDTGDKKMAGDALRKISEPAGPTQS
jgi:CBS domain-containing protein